VLSQSYSSGGFLPQGTRSHHIRKLAEEIKRAKWRVSTGVEARGAGGEGRDRQGVGNGGTHLERKRRKGCKLLLTFFRLKSLAHVLITSASLEVLGLDRPRLKQGHGPGSNYLGAEKLGSQKGEEKGKLVRVLP